ncbi:MAG: amidohydrolase [Defluviitaleaceae bacterium]|nr:amidohydrolase [Defluviitaleaceae bacterium]
MTLLIQNGKVMTMEGAIYEGASVLVKDGKIEAIGDVGQAPDGTKIIDAKGCYVTPGLIDAHTHLGLSGHGLRWEAQDHNETSDNVTPHLRTLDAINAFDQSFADTLAGGVTTVATSPGSANVIGGQLTGMKTGGSNRIEDLVIKAPLAMKCALGENPKGAHGQAKKAAPMTRMATAAIFREAFMKAQEYLAKKKAAQASEDGKMPDFNMKHEALIPLLEREIPVHIHAHQANDIHTAVRLIQEFNLKGIIIHASESHLIVDDLVAANMPLLIGPTLGFSGKPETKNKTFETVGILQRAGVKVCITTDHPVIPLHHLNVCAALAVKDGMDEEEAMKAITIYPAEILGFEDRVGTIAVGKDADIVIWDKHPLDITGKVLHTIIDGKIVYSCGK